MGWVIFCSLKDPKEKSCPQKETWYTLQELQVDSFSSNDNQQEQRRAVARLSTSQFSLHPAFSIAAVLTAK
jgi:hypothetical protein